MTLSTTKNCPREAKLRPPTVKNKHNTCAICPRTQQVKRKLRMALQPLLLTYPHNLIHTVYITTSNDQQNHSVDVHQENKKTRPKKVYLCVPARHVYFETPHDETRRLNFRQGRVTKIIHGRRPTQSTNKKTPLAAS